MNKNKSDFKCVVPDEEAYSELMKALGGDERSPYFVFFRITDGVGYSTDSASEFCEWPVDEIAYDKALSIVSGITCAGCAKLSELKAAREEIEQLKKDFKKLNSLFSAVSNGMQSIKIDSHKYEGHECLAKHKLLSLYDLWEKKVRPILLRQVDADVDDIKRK